MAALAVACVFLLVAVASSKTYFGLRLDFAGAWDFRMLHAMHGAGGLAKLVINSITPASAVGIAGMLAIAAIGQRRPARIAGLLVVIGGANVATALLKVDVAGHGASILGVPVGMGETFPSGHATAGMSFALSAVLVPPAKLRGVVAAAGALYALIVGYSLLVLSIHLPSDVLGGYLMAGLWAMLGVALIRVIERPSRASTGWIPRTSLVFGSALLLVVEAVALIAIFGPTQPHTMTFVGIVLGAAMIVLTLTFSCARLLTADTPTE